MKIVLINPSRRLYQQRDFWDCDFARQVFGVIPSAPLWMPTLAALTPIGIEVKIVDENVEEINYDERVNLVGIGALTINISRAYEIAREFRRRGIKVVIGGIHASMLPEEAAKNADVVVVGEAEKVWGNLVEDFVKGELKPIYRANEYPCLEDSPVPRFDLINNNKYIHNLIQTTRGCPFDCDFCSVKSFLGPQFRMKKIEQVVQEIEACSKYYEADVFGHKLKLEKGLFIVDDNIIGNRTYAKSLFQTLKTMKLPKWWCQASINLGKDIELLTMMKEAGCGKVIIGIESVEQKSLDGLSKRVNKVEDYEKCIKAIQSFGLGVVGAFILGADGDDEGTFEKTIDFINRNNIVYNYVNILTPLPGTRLFKKLENEGRLLHKNWFKYDSQNACFVPAGMSPEVLEEGYRWVYQRIYSSEALVKRMKGFWKEGKLSLNEYASDYLNKSLIDKLCYPVLFFRMLFSSGMNGLQIILNLFAEILQGKGDFYALISALIFSNYAFSLPKSRFKEFKKIQHALKISES